VRRIDGTLCLEKSIPDQIRLAFAGDNGVSIGWHSYACPLTTTNPNPNPNPRVIYGLSRTALTSNSINGNSSVYDTQNIFKTS
jgi:hypothetical protein